MKAIGFESGVDLVIEMSDRIRLARIKAGFEQEEMAEMMSVSSSTISNWENGRTSIKAPHLAYWAMLTGFNMSSLMPTPDPTEFARAEETSNDLSPP